MKRAFLIHGWSGNSHNGFWPWLRNELTTRGYQVHGLSMPDANQPAYEKWVPALEFHVGTPDEETMLVGHSMGGQTVLRYLERLPEGACVGKAILVAPVVETIMNMSGEEEQIARPWLERPFQFRKIRASAKLLVGIFSDNDQYIPLSSEQIVREQFGATTTISHARGHFSEDTGCHDLPEILPYL